MALAVSKRIDGLFDGHDVDLGRTAACPVVVLKAGVVRSGGQLVDPKTGVELDAYDAYETVHGQVRAESLGSVTRFDTRSRFR